jgi:hypothetical protein
MTVWQKVEMTAAMTAGKKAEWKVSRWAEPTATQTEHWLAGAMVGQLVDQKEYRMA